MSTLAMGGVSLGVLALLTGLGIGGYKWRLAREEGENRLEKIGLGAAGSAGPRWRPGGEGEGGWVLYKHVWRPLISSVNEQPDLWDGWDYTSYDDEEVKLASRPKAWLTPTSAKKRRS